MRSLKLTLSYDGSSYAGWQVQPHAVSVQQRLEEAWHSVTGETRRATASGRTDAGVHAIGQVVSIETESRLDAGTLRRALNANLPRDIVVRDVDEAPAGFHAIRDAVSKRYRYVLVDGPVPDVFARAFAWHVSQPLDVAAMQAAAKSLLGRHDFVSFQSAGSERKSTVRTIQDLTVERSTVDGIGRIMIEVEADGFLYNMVRAIVGVLVEVGRSAQPADWAAEVISARNRKAAAATAPPQGLFLVSVKYER